MAYQRSVFWSTVFRYLSIILLYFTQSAAQTTPQQILLSKDSLLIGQPNGRAKAFKMSGHATLSNLGVLTLNPLLTAGSCTNCNLSIDSYGRITTFANGSGGGGGITSLTQGTWMNFSVNPITSTGTVNADSASIAAYLVRRADSSATNGWVTKYLLTTTLSSYLTTASAASTYQPIITTGTTSQYFRGDLSLATFPTIPTVTPSTLSKFDDTNVTLTLGGTPSTALLQNVSITAGWTGTLADARIASAATWNAKQSALSGTGLVSFSGTTESYNTTSLSIASIISNETGSGNMVFSISPTLVTPVLGVATATSINSVSISGSGSIANSGTTSLTSFTGSGTSSGTNTGDQTSVTGNAGTATALQTARTINGVSFDGTANITVTAVPSNIQYAIKSSDLATTSTSMVDVTDMSFSVAASGNYIFEFSGRIGSTVTNGGRFTITCPAGATIEFQSWGNLGSSGTSVTPIGISSSGSETATYASGAAAGYTQYAYIIKGTVKVGGTAGTVQLRARSINAANTFTIYAGGQMQAHKIN